MINFDDVTKERKTKQNIIWPKILVHPYIIPITDGYCLNLLLNLIRYKPDIDKICLYVKDPHKEIYQFVIKNSGSLGLKH